MNKTLLRTPTSSRRASWCNDILEKNERLPRERSWLLIYNNYSISPSWIWSDKITIERVARVGYNHFISNKGNGIIVLVNSQTRFCRRFLFPQFYKASGKSIQLLNLAHYFPYDVKLRLLAHSWSFLANQKARNAIVGAENLLKGDSWGGRRPNQLSPRRSRERII